MNMCPVPEARVTVTMPAHTASTSSITLSCLPPFPHPVKMHFVLVSYVSSGTYQGAYQESSWSPVSAGLDGISDCTANPANQTLSCRKGGGDGPQQAGASGPRVPVCARGGSWVGGGLKL